MSLEAELKGEGRRLGLDLIGIASAEPFAAEVGLLTERQAHGYASGFEEQDIALRTDPARLLPGVRSIVAVGLNYYLPDEAQPGGPQPGAAELAEVASGGAAPLRGWLSRYTRGQVDYHRLLREKLTTLGDFLQSRVPGCAVQVHVDTGPPLDRAVAVRAGLGWFGKHSQLITREYASYVFLGELLTDVPLQPDPPARGTCGTCVRCLTACPTGAILRPGVIDASRCLSNITQLKGFLPREYRRALGSRVFGCDDCLEACPHSVRARPALEPGLQPNPEVGGLPDLARLLHMTRGEFKRWFAGGAAGWRGKTVLQRNAVVALGNSRSRAAVPLVLEALLDGRPVIRGHAVWALAELAAGGAVLPAAARERLTSLAQAETDPAVQEELRLALADLPG